MITEDVLPFYPLLMAYRDFEMRLLDCLERHEGRDSPEEDCLLDVADEVWYDMNHEEREFIRTGSGPYRTRIRELRDIDAKRMMAESEEL